MSFKESVEIVSSKFVYRAVFADWWLNLTEDGRRIKLAFEELASYMFEMIKERLSMGKGEHNDLFSNLLASSFSDEFGTTALTEDELTGNIFAFLLAGHETTAHTLCFTFALLALYPEEQEILFQHIKSVLSDGRTPEHKDMPFLTQSMAVLYETLRLYPAATVIMKQSAEDTTLNASNIRGEKTTIPVPKGTQLQISTSGVHYNRIRFYF
jgi:cytochrome P450